LLRLEGRGELLRVLDNSMPCCAVTVSMSVVEVGRLTKYSIKPKRPIRPKRPTMHAIRMRRKFINSLSRFGRIGPIGLNDWIYDK